MKRLILKIGTILAGIGVLTLLFMMPELSTESVFAFIFTLICFAGCIYLKETELDRILNEG